MHILNTCNKLNTNTIFKVVFCFTKDAVSGIRVVCQAFVFSLKFLVFFFLKIEKYELIKNTFKLLILKFLEGIPSGTLWIWRRNWE